MDNLINFVQYNLLEVLAINLVVFLTGFIANRLNYNRPRLRKQGYPEDYIELAIRHENLWIAFAMGTFFSSQLVILAISFIANVDVTLKLFIQRVLPISAGMLYFAMVVAKPLFRKFSEEYKLTAKKTGTEIIIDFNYRVLKKVFNWKIELITALLMFYITFRYLDHNPAVYFYITVPWVFVLMLTRMKNQALPTIRFNYKNMITATVVIFVARIYLFSAVFFDVFQGRFSQLELYNIILVCTLICTMLYAVLKGVMSYKKIEKLFPGDPLNGSAAVS